MTVSSGWGFLKFFFILRLSCRVFSIDRKTQDRDGFIRIHLQHAKHRLGGYGFLVFLLSRGGRRFHCHQSNLCQMFSSNVICVLLCDGTGGTECRPP